MTEQTVFVVDDDPDILRAIRRLANQHDLHVETFGSARAFLDVFDPEVPGCLVADVRLPDMDGVAMLEDLVGRGSRIPVIMITGYGDIELAVRSMRVGAFDFIEKPFRSERLVDQIGAALRHDRKIRARTSEQREMRRRLARLTPRESEVLELVIDGYTSRQIGEKLGLSPKTVQVHRAETRTKLDAHSVAELTRMALTARES